MSKILSHWSSFDHLTLHELYALLKLRCDVFIVEQKSLFADIDGRDPDAMHLRLLEDGLLLGAARVFAPDTAGMASIGRVVIAPQARGRALGQKLMREALAYCDSHFANHAIKISAQLYLRDFYGSFGFAAASDVYDEDGILHIDMVRA